LGITNILTGTGFNTNAKCFLLCINNFVICMLHSFATRITLMFCQFH